MLTPAARDVHQADELDSAGVSMFVGCAANTQHAHARRAGPSHETESTAPGVSMALNQESKMPNPQFAVRNPQSALHYLLSTICYLLLLFSPALAQSTRPTTNPSSVAALELRAMTAFNKGEYARALPLLVRLSELFRDNADRLGSLQEMIRVCQRNMAKGIAAEPARPAPPAADEVKMSPEERKPHSKPKPGETTELMIKQLGNFEYDAQNGGNIPQDVKQLDGALIRTWGYMIPLDQADHITEFALVPSLFACCFGQPPTVQHTLVVHCPKGKAVRYYPDELAVEGKLHVEEKKDAGLVVSVFEMDCTSVKPAAK